MPCPYIFGETLVVCLEGVVATLVACQAARTTEVVTTNPKIHS